MNLKSELRHITIDYDVVQKECRAKLKIAPVLQDFQNASLKDAEVIIIPPEEVSELMKLIVSILTKKGEA